MVREIVTIVALTLTVSLTIFCSLGLFAMRSSYERLHFITPPAAVGSFLLTIAVFVTEPQIVAGLKTLFIAFLLVFSNAIVSHATSRAMRIRALGGWLTGDSLPEESAGAEEERL